MAVAFHDHEFADLDGAILGDTADVIPGEIDEHDVLGALLRIGEEFGGEGFVLLRRLAPPARPGDGTDADAPLDRLHVHLGRATDEGEFVAELEAEHVGRGIHVPQGPVEVDGTPGEVVFKPLRGHDLEDVAGEDVILRFQHHALVFLARRVAAHGRLGRLSHERKGREGPRFAELFDEAIDAFAGGGVGSGGVGEVVGAEIGHELQLAEAVVENDESLGDDKGHVGQSEPFIRRRGHGRFEESHHVVAEKSDRSSREDRQALDRDRFKSGHEPLELVERIALALG